MSSAPGEDPSEPDGMVARDVDDFGTPYAEPEAPGRAEPAKRRNGFGETLSTILWALVIALVVRTVLFQPFHVPTGSMQPTLVEGDYLVASKFAYGFNRYSLPGAPPLGDFRLFAREPERGDVVLFRAPHEPGQVYIKRVLGLAGDRIEIRGGLIILNGSLVPRGPLGELTLERVPGEPQVYQAYEEILPNSVAYTVLDRGISDLDDIAEFTVPEGRYFMLGDNRDESRDSRVAPPEGPGLVPATNLIGRGEVVLLSVTPEFQLFAPWTWWHVRPSRFFVSLDGGAS